MSTKVRKESKKGRLMDRFFLPCLCDRAAVCDSATCTTNCTCDSDRFVTIVVPTLKSLELAV